MILNGKTVVFYVDGQGTMKPARVLGSRFNRLVRSGKDAFFDVSGAAIAPSKSLSWKQVGEAVRTGKSAQASKSTKKGSRQPSRKESDPVEGEAL